MADNAPVDQSVPPPGAVGSAVRHSAVQLQPRSDAAICLRSAAWEPNEVKVKVPGKWRLVLDYQNNNPIPANMISSWTTGFTSIRETTHFVRATQSVEGKIVVGDVFQFVKVEATFTSKSESGTSVMERDEISSTRELQITTTVPPNSRLIRWQLLADVAGNEVGFNKVVDSHDPTYIDNLDNRVEATVIRARKIVAGTKFRIKHKERQQYISVTTRKSWPAATLSYADIYHFCFSPASNGQYRIKTFNTTDRGYDYMYSSTYGGIYFDKERNPTVDPNDTRKQLWTISRSLPLYDGDTIIIQNTNWVDAYLCYYNGSTTNVFCEYAQMNEWVLEVV